jgi:23S rRNA pseudouridine2605 synthase
LDYLSQGLLLLTNDGEVTRRLTHPSFEVETVYQVWVRGGDISKQAAALGGALLLDGVPIKPAKVQVLRTEADGAAVLEVRITEGRNRQVRRMCALCGLEVLQLMRVGEGALTLGELQSGAWRYLTEAEITYLREIQ